MCGISGFLDMERGVDTATLMKMNQIIRHRGPDDEGYAFFSEKQSLMAWGRDTDPAWPRAGTPPVEQVDGAPFFLGLGHRRLSILDLSIQGHQPMTDETGSLFVAFNGEIFNYVELIQELREMGYAFHTTCDTEVLLNAYRAWGEACVTHFNGMWAFALWDSGKHRLFCSRDRLGVKPFHYYHQGNKLVFGSELKQLIQDDTLPRVMDEETLATNLIYGLSDYNERTLIQDMVMLPGGHNLLVEVDVPGRRIASFAVKRYWKLETDYYSQQPERGYAQLVGEEFSRSVRYRRRSDAKVGALLSGGLDSSCIVAEVCRQMKEERRSPADFHTFTSCYRNAPQHDERSYAQLLAQSAGCTEHLVFPEPEDMARDYERLTWHCEGITGFSVLALYKLLDEVNRQGIKVILNGQCGDETMFGYERYYAFYFADLVKRGKLRQALKEFRMASENSRLSKKQLAEYYAYFNFPVVRNRKKQALAKKYLTPKVARTLNYPLLKPLLFPKSLRELQYYELTATQLTHILRFDDRIYMSHSIESRVPFVDYRFIETAAKIPPRYKIKNGYTKSLMREYMDGKMPNEVTWRKNKIGFSAPADQWVKKFPAGYVENLMRDARSAPYFQLDAIGALYRSKPHDPMIASFIAVETFMRLFDVSSPAKEAVQ